MTRVIVTILNRGKEGQEKNRSAGAGSIVVMVDKPERILRRGVAMMKAQSGLMSRARLGFLVYALVSFGIALQPCVTTQELLAPYRLFRMSIRVAQQGRDDGVGVGAVCTRVAVCT